jgi:hypothetical protein
MLNRAEILSKCALKKETVRVDEWGGDVVVSEMTGERRDKWEQSLSDKDKSGRLISPRAKMVLFSVTDEEGNMLFNENDLEAVGRLSSASLDKICNASLALNCLRPEDVEQASKN